MAEYRALQKVFKNFRYLLAASLIAVFVFTVAVWLPNLSLVGVVVFSETVSFVEKLNILTSLYGSIHTNFTAISAGYTIVISILFGISIALLTYYVRRQRSLVGGKSTAASIGGIVSGFFGIGCAACGTFLITTFLATFGAAGLVSFLPFGGEEFGLLGVALLSYSVYSTLGKISDPIVCGQ